jgi:hypothetical protein
MNWESINSELIPLALSIAVIELGFYGRISNLTDRRTVQPPERQNRSTFSKVRTPTGARDGIEHRKTSSDSR